MFGVDVLSEKNLGKFDKRFVWNFIKIYFLVGLVTKNYAAPLWMKSLQIVQIVAMVELFARSKKKYPRVDGVEK